MADQNDKKALSFVERMKQQAAAQKIYGGEMKKKEAGMDARVCPNCGAGRGRRDDLTECAFCGFTFMDVELGEGIFINNEQE